MADTEGRKPKIYNLDMILSVGYRVNSKRGIAFRRWANSVLKHQVCYMVGQREKSELIVELGYQSCWYEGHITDDENYRDHRK